jgi:hypothetical protein
MKYSICILAHHKPWLMMSSIISLAMQEDTEFDLHVIYIRGDGENRDRESYSNFFEIADRDLSKNFQLTNDDKRILAILKDTNFTINFHEVDNDHGLDTGAWYKFIKKGVWKEYDHSFFMMEGFIFTSPKILSSVKKFTHNHRCDFLDMGFEKRYISKELLFNMLTRVNPSEMDIYHQEIINKTFDIFCQDQEFTKIFNSWSVYDKKDVSNMSQDLLSSLSENFEGVTFYNVPSSTYSIKEKMKLYILNILKGKRYLPPVKDFVIVNPEGTYYQRDSLFDSINIEGVNYHKEKSPFFYGCMCQHVFSHSFLESMEKKFNEFDLWKTADLPFSATPLESIWGMLPSWLGFEKWYFDGVHRPRKNYLTYKREDDVIGMCKYINRHFKGKIKVIAEGDFIKITRISKQFEYIANILGDSYYVENIKKNN